MSNNSVFSVRLKVLISVTSLRLSEREFHVVRSLTETFDDKASDVRGTDSKFLSA